MQPTELSVRQAGALLRSGDLTSVELTEACLDRIAQLNPDIRAFVTITDALARAAAKRADADFAAGVDRGLMQGIPFATKDLIDTEGVETSYGAKARRGHVPHNDAVVVARLLAGGAVPIGKVATYEYALTGPSPDGAYPPAINPWNRDHITGGSSSGSAAAVAAGFVRVAIGTDTGGSIRSPASYCGTVGLKPAYDRVPGQGVFPLSPSLDTIGPLAACVDDAVLMLGILTGNPVAPTDPGIAGLRIGYARHWFADDPDTAPAVLQAMDAAASDLTLQGAQVTLVDLPDYAVMEAAGAIILHAEALDQHRADLSGPGRAFGRMAYQNLIAGVALTKADVAAARKAQAQLRRETDAALGGFDAVVTATNLTPAPPVAAFADGGSVWTPMRTLPFNLTGHPVLALPIGFARGLPLGMQIIGRDEAMICRIGAAYEAATDHSAQRPYLA